MENSKTLGALGTEYHLKQEIQRCHACNDWIFNKIYRINRCNKMLYFHEFCFNNLTKKNNNFNVRVLTNDATPLGILNKLFELKRSYLWLNVF